MILCSQLLAGEYELSSCITETQSERESERKRGTRVLVQRNKQSSEGWREMDGKGEQKRSWPVSHSQRGDYRRSPGTTRAARRCKYATCGGAEGREGQGARREDTNREKNLSVCEIEVIANDDSARRRDKSTLSSRAAESTSLQSERAAVIACGTYWTFEVSCLVTH